MSLLLKLLVVLLAGVGTIYLGITIADRMPPIDYLDAKAMAVSVPQGGTIDVHFDVYRYRICPSVKATRLLTDSAGDVHVISNYTTATQTRPGREAYDRTITIPEAAAVGNAVYNIKILFACNWVHNLGWPVEVTSPPIFFRVTPSETLGLVLPPSPQDK